MTDVQMRLLKKVEELTLYTLEQEARLARVDALEAKLADMDRLAAENAALTARLARIEAALAARQADSGQILGKSVISCYPEGPFDCAAVRVRSADPARAAAPSFRSL